MRVAKLSRTLLLLALPAVLATCALAQEAPNAQPSAVRAQLAKDPGPSQSQPAKKNQQPKAPVTPALPKAPAKATSQTPTAPMVGKPADEKAPGKAASQKTAKPPVEKPAEEKASVTRRDPFETLLKQTRAGNTQNENLPPGKAGLVVSTLRINGIVRDSAGMIAVVSNPQQRVYFLREGDKVYDGSVQHITLEAISFQQIGKDAFGKPIERQVTKRLYPSPGEQQ